MVHSHSVTALGKIGGPQALPAVISALKTETVRSALDIGVCYRAIEALCIDSAKQQPNS